MATEMGFSRHRRRAAAFARLSALSLRLVVFGVAMFDLSVIARWTGGRIGPFEALADHLIIAALACLLIGLAQRRASPQLIVLAALLILLGPVGGFAILIARLDLADVPAADPARNLRSEGSRDEAADQSADPSGGQSAADEVCASILQGRRPTGAAEPMQTFEQIFATAETPRQQRALAVISRSYRPEMLAALKIALSSPRPAVKVQASAVYAKLRSGFAERAKQLLGTDVASVSAGAAGRYVADCDAVAGSGFVDASIADRLRARRDRLQSLPAPPPDRAEDRADPGPAASSVVPAPGDPSLLRVKRYSCGGIA